MEIFMVLSLYPSFAGLSSTGFASVNASSCSFFPEMDSGEQVKVTQENSAFSQYNQTLPLLLLCL